MGGCIQSALTYSLGVWGAPATSTQKIQKYRTYRSTLCLQKYLCPTETHQQQRPESLPPAFTPKPGLLVQSHRGSNESFGLGSCLIASLCCCQKRCPRRHSAGAWLVPVLGVTRPHQGDRCCWYKSPELPVAGFLHIRALCEFQGPNMIMGMCLVIENQGWARKQNPSFTLQGFFPLPQRAWVLHKTMVFRLQHQALHNWWAQEQQADERIWHSHSQSPKIYCTGAVHVSFLSHWSPTADLYVMTLIEKE